MTNSSQHSAHLAIFPFRQRQLNPCIGDSLPNSYWRLARRDLGWYLKETRLARECSIPTNHHTALEQSKCLLRWNVLDKRPVSSPMAKAWIEQAINNPSFIAQQ